MKAVKVGLPSGVVRYRHTHSLKGKDSHKKGGHKFHVEAKHDGRILGTPKSYDLETKGHKRKRRGAKEHGGSRRMDLRHSGVTTDPPSPTCTVDEEM